MGERAVKGRWLLKLEGPGVCIGGNGYDGVLTDFGPGVIPPRIVFADSVDVVFKPLGSGLEKASSKEGDAV